MYISIESDKHWLAPWDLHDCVQCAHQRAPLIGILRGIRRGKTDLAQRCIAYTNDMCHKMYKDVVLACRCLPARAEAWPEYTTSAVLVSRPQYQVQRDSVADTMAEGTQAARSLHGRSVAETSPLCAWRSSRRRKILVSTTLSLTRAGRSRAKATACAHATEREG